MKNRSLLVVTKSQRLYLKKPKKKNSFQRCALKTVFKLQSIQARLAGHIRNWKTRNSYSGYHTRGETCGTGDIVDNIAFINLCHAKQKALY